MPICTTACPSAPSYMGFVLIGIIITTALTGCTTLGYYRQAISGHLEVMQGRVPLSELIAAADTRAELKRQLQLVAAARKFATHELFLPDNDSYRSYSDLKRKYVVWNVFAAPELSIEPVSSCFLFVGCLSYRGFFNEARARQFAASLTAAGNDTFVGGVAAYSTLGWFDDPVLNTMLVWDDVRIVEVIFHELAHQVLYADGDTVFNESFASAVAEIGIERWLAFNHQASAGRPENARHQDQFFKLLLRYRDKLGTLYTSAVSDAKKHTQKKQLFSELSDAYLALKQTWGGYDGYDDWMLEDLNNAKLTSVATYHDYVPAIRSILERVDNDLSRFYAALKVLGSLSNDERKQCLGAAVAEAACLDEIVDAD